MRMKSKRAHDDYMFLGVGVNCGILYSSNAVKHVWVVGVTVFGRHFLKNLSLEI